MADVNDQFDQIGDTLINLEHVRSSRVEFLQQMFKAYKRASVLLGYLSRLRDYESEYQNLSTKVSAYRKDLLVRYKDLLMDDYETIFKQLLVAPNNTEWFNQGVHKYNKVKSYSTYYYRRNLYIVLEEDELDLDRLKKIIEKIVLLDRYYEIYEETILYFMQTSSRFESIMRKHFPQDIHF